MFSLKIFINLPLIQSSELQPIWLKTKLMSNTAAVIFMFCSLNALEKIILLYYGLAYWALVGGGWFEKSLF